MPIWVVCDTTSATLRDNFLGGNLQLAGDFNCNSVGDAIHLIYNDRVSKWVELSRSDN